jgi:hypothetical protein
VIPASDIDRVLLSFCEDSWLKVARIVGKTMKTFEQRGTPISADAIDARLAALVDSRQLEARGNIRNWRYSEVRLPPLRQTRRLLRPVLARRGTAA